MTEVTAGQESTFMKGVEAPETRRILFQIPLPDTLRKGAVIHTLPGSRIPFYMAECVRERSELVAQLEEKFVISSKTVVLP